MKDVANLGSRRMKITQPDEQLATTPNGRKLRMEALLSAWRRWRWIANDGELSSAPPTSEAALTTEERQLWASLLRKAEPIAPRTQASRFNTHATIHGLTLDELTTSGAAKVLGSRVSFRPFSAAANIGGAVLVPPCPALARRAE